MTTKKRGEEARRVPSWILLRLAAALSEHVLESDLNDTVTTSGSDLSGIWGRYAAVANVCDGRARIAEVEVIEGIQGITSQLKPVLFRDGEGLLNTDVPVPEARPEYTVPL